MQWASSHSERLPERQCMHVESPVGAETVLDGRRYVNFGGSSYLGLCGEPEILDAGISALRMTGAGYQIARACGVVSRAHEEVEAEAAAFFESEAALYLAGGYHVGFAAVAALKQQFQLIFFDQLAHYALRDAIATSGLPCHEFQHLDPESLAQGLKQHVRAGDRPLVVTDGLFATLGEIAPLRDLASIIEPYQGHLLVDESHSFGVLGERGRGAYEHHGVSRALTTIGGSLGKAFGCSGGIIPADSLSVAILRATPVGRGASAGSPVNAAMCATSLAHARRHPELLQRLRANTARAKAGLRALGLEVCHDDVPIAAFAGDSPESTRDLQARLMSEGMFVLYTNYIGAGASGVIRCAFFADHTSAHIDQLLDALRRLL